MKKLFILLLFSGFIYGQSNPIIRLNNMNDSLATFLTNEVDSAITAQLGSATIGDADSLGNFPASDYLKWSDTTSTLATQYDLSQLEVSVISDSTDSLRVDVNQNTANISTNTTNISNLTTLASNKFYLGNGSNVATEVTLSGDVTSTNAGVMSIEDDVIVDDDINSSAGIDATKIANGTVSDTEFQYVDGATSNIQSQINALTAGTVTVLNEGKIYIGSATNVPVEQDVTGDIGITTLGVTSISSGVIVDADINASAGITATKLGAGTVDNTELGYINGLTSPAQTQLTTNASAISSNDTDISNLQDSTTAQRTDINTNVANIATNTADISTNTSDVDALETLANGQIYMGNGSNIASEVTVSGDFSISNTGVGALSAGSIVDSDVNASAAIDATKIHDGSVSNTEFGYINSLTSNAQTQITNNANDISSNDTDISNINTLASGQIYLGNGSNVATEVALSGDVTMDNAGVTYLQANSVSNTEVVSGANIDASKLGTGVVSNTELNYLNGVTSGIQTQFDNLIVTDTIKARGGSYSINIPSPQPNEEIPLGSYKYAYTIDSLKAVLITSGTTDSVGFNMFFDGAGLFATYQTCNDYSPTAIDVTSRDLFTSFGDATIGADEFSHIELDSISGTPSYITITVYFTEN